jgi:hypothetical protein
MILINITDIIIIIIIIIKMLNGEFKRHEIHILGFISTLQTERWFEFYAKFIFQLLITFANVACITLHYHIKYNGSFPLIVGCRVHFRRLNNDI